MDDEIDFEQRLRNCHVGEAASKEHTPVSETIEPPANPADCVATSAQTTDAESISGDAREEEEMVEPQRGEGLESRRMMYSFEEMEAMRFSNMAEQRKLWKIVGNGLDAVVKKEYDELTSSKRNRHRLAKKQLCLETPYTGKSDIDDVIQLDGSCSGKAGDEDEYLALEEEHVEDDDGDGDEVYSIQRPAFVVKGEPNFDSGPPEDGLEYLRRVRWEAAKIPNVRIAKIDKSKLNKEQSDYMPKIPDIANCEEHLLPSKEWEDKFLADFSQLRTEMSRLEDTDVESYEGQPIFVLDSCENVKLFPDCLGNEIDPSSNLGNDESVVKPSGDENFRNYPHLSVILKMTSVARASMLKKKIHAFCGTNTLQKHEFMWLFALCAVVDTPLDGDTCASLRSLLRKCASWRAEKSVLDDDVAMLNIIATISGRYFGQLGRPQPQSATDAVSLGEPLSLASLDPTLTSNTVMVDEDTIEWSEAVESSFIELISEEAKEKLHSTTLDDIQWAKVELEMTSRFGHSYNIEKLKAKWNSFRHIISELQTLVATTGFGWDPSQNTVTADDDVWENHLESHPDAEKFRRKEIVHYDMLARVFGGTIATDQFSVGPVQVPTQVEDETRDSSDILEDAPVTGNETNALVSGIGPGLMGLSEACNAAKS